MEDNNNSEKIIALKEIATHNSDKDCYLAIHGLVYDISKFLDEVCAYEIVPLDAALAEQKLLDALWLALWPRVRGGQRAAVALCARVTWPQF